MLNGQFYGLGVCSAEKNVAPVRFSKITFTDWCLVKGNSEVIEAKTSTNLWAEPHYQLKLGQPQSEVCQEALIYVHLQSNILWTRVL